MKIATVGIVGAGVMGAGIAEAIGRAGVKVTLVDSVAGASQGALRRIENSVRLHHLFRSQKSHPPLETHGG